MNKSFDELQKEIETMEKNILALKKEQETFVLNMDNVIYPLNNTESIVFIEDNVVIIGENKAFMFDISEVNIEEVTRIFITGAVSFGSVQEPGLVSPEGEHFIREDNLGRISAILSYKKQTMDA